MNSRAAGPHAGGAGTNRKDTNMTLQESVERVAAYLAARCERLAPPRVITSWHNIDLTARDLQALVDAARRPVHWKDPGSGAVYDLTRQYLDRDGDVWEPSGWLQWADGTLLPVLSAPACGEEHQDVRLSDVVERFGPLTARSVAVEAGF
jgi:hypothetical protein